jgi:hypothetical protein
MADRPYFTNPTPARSEPGRGRAHHEEGIRPTAQADDAAIGSDESDDDDDDEAAQEEIRRGWRTANITHPPPRPQGPDGRLHPTRGCLPIQEVEERMKNDGFAKYVANPTNESDKRRIVYYLYGREMYWNLRRGKRVQRIKEFLSDGAIQRMDMILVYYESGSSSSSSSSSSSPRGVCDRTNRSRKQHRVWRTTQEKILRFAAGKGGGGAITVVLQNGVPYIQFLQVESKSCYIAAPAALVSYLLAIAELGKCETNANAICRVEPVDASRYIRHHFTNEQLERRVVGNKGGSSQDVLRSMVGSAEEGDYRKYKIPVIDAHQRQVLSNFVTGFVLDALNRHGPALVSCFDVKSVKMLRLAKESPEDDSEVVYLPSFDVDKSGTDELNYRSLGRYGDDPSITQKIAAFEKANGDSEATHSAGANRDDTELDSGCPGTEESKELEDTISPSQGGEGAGDDRPHAMVLIGIRRDDVEQSKHWFLLQNSWESLPVLEVSDAYMARHLNSKGYLEFVARDVAAAGVRASGAVSTVVGLHHECNLDDGGEEASDMIEEDGRGGS